VRGAGGDGGGDRDGSGQDDGTDGARFSLAGRIAARKVAPGGIGGPLPHRGRKPARHRPSPGEKIMSCQITGIYRYPVKGLSAEPLAGVALSPGKGLPGDRRFALARAGTAFDPADPAWLPKSNFIMLARDQEIARLRTTFDDAGDRLGIAQDGEPRLAASLAEPGGRAAVEAFFAQFLGDALSGPPKVVTAPGHVFTDASRKPNSTTYHYVSLVNLASVRALEQVAGVPVDPLRFRANLYFDGAEAWSELGWVGSDLRVGSAGLRVIAATTRCPATEVNPETAARDLDVPALLRKAFGHIFMGIYAEVAQPGDLRPGDAILPGPTPPTAQA